MMERAEKTETMIKKQAAQTESKITQLLTEMKAFEKNLFKHNEVFTHIKLNFCKGENYVRLSVLHL